MSKTMNRVLLLVLLAVYAFSQIYLIADTLGCTLSPAFPFWTAALCLTTWLAVAMPFGLWTGLPASALILLLAYRRFHTDLILQLNDVLDRITGVYVEHMAFSGETYPYLQAVSDHSLLMIFLFFLLASYMAAALTSRSGRVGLALLGALPFSLGCLLVNETPPVLCVFGLVLFLTLLAVSGPQYQERSHSWRTIVSLLFPLSLLLGLLIWLINPSQYEYIPPQLDLSEQFEELERRLDSWMNERFSLDDLPSVPNESEPSSTREKDDDILWQNGSGALDLTQNSSVEDLEKEFLRIRPVQDGSYYLRAVSYGDYAGTGWLPADESIGSSSLSFTAQSMLAAGAEEKRLSIQELTNLKYRCLPYFSTEAKSYDSFVPASLSSSYTGIYVSTPDLTPLLRIPAQLADTEESYRLYAHRVYTTLPEDTRSALLQLCANVGLTADSGDIVTEVARYVQASGTYDVDTPAYPSNDYALYFLTVSHRGYCIHFATAATAIYRALGIPARITEGFLVSAKGGEATIVRGENAHAWVEVYQDGLGWLPVEVTGQAGLHAEAREANIPEPTAEPAPAETEERAPEPQPAASQPTPMPVGVVTDASAPSASASRAASALWKVFRFLLVLLALLAVFPLRRVLLLHWRERRYSQPDARRAVIYMYQMAQRAAVFGVKTSSALQSAAEKAAFSSHAITESERIHCKAALDAMLTDCCAGLRFWQKARFRYLMVLK